MTAFTADFWLALQDYAPIDSDFCYTLKHDRNSKPSESKTDVTTTKA